MLQETDMAVWQKQTQITNKTNKRSTALERSVRQLLGGLNSFHSTNLTLNSDMD